MSVTQTSARSLSDLASDVSSLVADLLTFTTAISRMEDPAELERASLEDIQRLDAALCQLEETSVVTLAHVESQVEFLGDVHNRVACVTLAT